MSQPLLLHVGCGKRPIKGWVNADLYPGPDVDVAFDLQKDWPFPDNAASFLYASHVLEHLTDPQAFFREAWRVLHPNGQVIIRVPYGGSAMAWIDLTHVRPWYAESFCFLQPGYADDIFNPQHDGWRYPFGITTVDLRLSPTLAPLLRRRWLRRLVLPRLKYLTNVVDELWACLFTLKTPEAVALYRQTHPDANALGTRWVMYRSHFTGGPPKRPGETDDVVQLGNFSVLPAYDFAGGSIIF